MRAALSACLALACATAFAQTEEEDWNLPHVAGLDLFIGTPSAAPDIFQSFIMGGSLRVLLSRSIEASLDYYFLGLDYYYPEPDGDWVGPVPWSSVPSTFSGLQSNWIFFQTRHCIAPTLWYLHPLSDFSIRLGAGPAIAFVLPSESAHYYPDLSEQFTAFARNFDALPGWTFHLGLEYHPVPIVALGVEYIFVADDAFDFWRHFAQDPPTYIDRAGHIVFYAGLRI